MDQDKNITTASIEGEVENVSANDIKGMKQLLQSIKKRTKKIMIKQKYQKLQKQMGSL